MIRLSGILSLLLLPGLFLHAAFDPAKDVQITFSPGAVLLSVPPGANLKARMLAVTQVSGSGSLRVGPLPKAVELDEAGDPIYHGVVRIPVSGLAGDEALEVRYQACTEGPQGICYLPLFRRIGAQSLPGPVLEDASGRPFDLGSLRGSFAVVDFWASWCGPCRKSFPALDKLAATYGPRGLKVVGISLDEDGEAMARFLESVPVGFPIARDASGALARRYQIASMPTMLILDREGKVVARFEGGGKLPETAIEALLAGKPLPPDTGRLAAAGLRATGDLKAWNRGHLADPIMSLDGDPLSRTLWEHIHTSKEGAAGNGGAAGGGCGCN